MRDLEYELAELIGNSKSANDDMPKVPISLLEEILEFMKSHRDDKVAAWKGWNKSYYKGKDDCGEPIFGRCTYYTCSQCGRRTVVADKFCPGCGYEMIDKV